MLLLTLVLSLSMVLAACGGNDAGDKGGKAGDKKAAKDGGTVTYAVDNKFEGLFERGLYGSGTDSEILDFTMDGLVNTDENLNYIPHIAEWDTKDNKVYTFKFKKGVKWHNGEELTVEDWKYALEVIAHKDYDGPRYVNVETIAGAKDYHKGKAKKISGIKVINDYEIEITFDKARVNNLENLWTYPMPRKHYEGIAVKDLSKSKQVRKEPIGLGPFKVKKIVQGEYVELERFDDYWQGKPKLDKVIVKVIDPSLAVGSLKNGEVDIMKIRPDNIEELKGVDQIEIKEGPSLSYSYVAFKLGHWDKDAGHAVMDNPKFQNKNLRQAMFYALDRQSIIDAYLAGKAKVINKPIPAVHWIAADEKELTQYNYDPEKAKKLLAEAGYKDIDGDGFVEDPEGKKFKINFDHYAGPNTFEGRANAMIQNWRDVGLDVKLNGGLKEFNLYNELNDKDDPSIEVFFGSWATGSDPDPSGLWASDAFWNKPRWVNEESDNLLQEGLSEKSFDKEYRKDVYVKWQQLMNEELPALPLWENIELAAANKRLQNVKMDPGGVRVDVYKWAVTDGK
ncbi:oligopeptide ABC transporter substrate-binding protein [Numidum massiliense]|uniref:oligopeptide ABC transporter substrate-binding protein n=1 Tax=Numidum massiliense TaxID=1522315 RepID=UPI0006D5A97F|nr:oligopeptide ABC transporter substrate-binding protein [Numidum massiliense]